MRRALALLVACHQDAAPPPPAPAPVAKPADAAVADAGPAGVERLNLFDRDVLCFDDKDCVRLTATSDARGYKATPVPPAERAIAFDDGCTWHDRTLACGTTTLDARVVFGREEHYLVEPGVLETFKFASGEDKPATRTKMKPFPGGVTQISVGFRTGCVLAGDASVWCWSDPASPKRMTVPDHVEQIAIIDPFGLCVRTTDGAVSCTPPFVESDRFACSMSSRACGEGDVENPKIDKPFDPLTALSRPLANIALPEAATALVADDTLLYLIGMDVIKLQPGEPFGACAKTGKTAVCWKPCGKAWGVVHVTGLPTGAVLSPDQDAGYAIGIDASLWTWRATCDAHDVAATKVALPPIARLVPALHVRAGPQLWTTTRCALTRDHAVTCWALAAHGTGAMIAPFDPRSP